MATAIGTNTLTSLSRHHIMPDVIDATYDTNALTYRMLRGNKRMIEGGTQIEVPVMYKKYTTGGPWSGYDQVDVTPQDTVKNMVWDWKGHYSHVTIDRFSLVKMNSPQAAFNVLRFLFEQAKEDIADKLGTGLWSDATTNTEEIDGLKGAVDDGGIASTYAGLTRSSNTWLNSTEDAASSTLTEAILQTNFSAVKVGGRAPTSIFSRSDQYNRFIALGIGSQRFPVGAAGHDEQLYSPGFTNALFNNVPWIEDSHVFDGPNSSNSAIVLLCEDYIYLAVSEDGDMIFEPFQRPHDQFAYVSLMAWIGNLIHQAPARSGKLTNISA
jgi:hypothetical protein